MITLIVSIYQALTLNHTIYVSSIPWKGGRVAIYERSRCVQFSALLNSTLSAKNVQIKLKIIVYTFSLKHYVSKSRSEAVDVNGGGGLEVEFNTQRPRLEITCHANSCWSFLLTAISHTFQSGPT